MHSTDRLTQLGGLALPAPAVERRPGEVAVTPRQPIGPSDPPRALDTPPRLIAADAALTLVEQWRTELRVLRRRSPGSDAVTTLADCIAELSAAITAGQDVVIKLTVAEAHNLSRIPVSTLRWLCNRKPELIGARKRRGVWYIDRAVFERYLASPHAPPIAPQRRTHPARPSPTE